MRVDNWPYEIEKLDGDKVTFKPVVATIAKVFPGGNGKNPGWKFTEDTTPDGNYKGVIWNHAGKWNKEANRSEPYTGNVGREGLRVQVVLQTKKGRDRTFYDVRSIKPVADDDSFAPAAASGNGQSPRDAYREPATKAADPYAERDSRISRAQAFNALTSVLVDGKPTFLKSLEERGLPYDHLVEQWVEGFADLMHGMAPFAVPPDTEPEPEPPAGERWNTPTIWPGGTGPNTAEYTDADAPDDFIQDMDDKKDTPW